MVTYIDTFIKYKYKGREEFLDMNAAHVLVDVQLRCPRLKSIAFERVHRRQHPKHIQRVSNNVVYLHKRIHI